MRIWIDLGNSPHPLFFAPISKRFTELGHTVVVTARDNAQTLELARQRWETVTSTGGESPPTRVGKARATTRRVRRLVLWARKQRPDIAVSHNCYAQIMAARVLRMPVVTTMDFEFRATNHLAFRLASVVLLPEALRALAVHRQGARPRKTYFYAGLKEELYLGDFEPDPDVLATVGVADRQHEVLVVVRTPPSRAAYHRFENPLFEEILTLVDREPHALCVVLARHAEQHQAIAELGLERCVVPSSAIDSRSLMRAADLVIGAGGTMTREAAMLGVPTLSVFAGRQPAVDQWLERRGLLRRLTRADDLLPLERRRLEPVPLETLRRRSAELTEWFVQRVLEAA